MASSSRVEGSEDPVESTNVHTSEKDNSTETESEASDSSLESSSESDMDDESDVADEDVTKSAENTKDKSILEPFQFSCLHKWEKKTLPEKFGSLVKERLARKKDSKILPSRKLAANFEPWWDSFGKCTNSSKQSKAHSKKGDEDTYDSWFRKSCTEGDNWLCGPAPPEKPDTSKVKDIEVPSIYSRQLETKGRRALKKARKAEREQTAGKQWYDMKAPDVDDSVRMDMELIRMRGILDPKKFFKHQDRKALPKYFQMGTVVDEGTDFYNSRLTKKQRKQTLVEELMADANVRQYNKRKYNELQQKRNKKFGKKKKT